MNRNLTLLPLLGALVLAAGCGSSDDKRSPPSANALPPGAAARVGHTTITRAEVEHIQPYVAPVPSTDQSGRAKPPEFADCIAAQRAQDKNTATADLKTGCRQQYFNSIMFTVGYLIKRTWSVKEAEQHGVEPSDALVQRRAKAQLATGSKQAARTLLATKRNRQTVMILVKTYTRDERLSKALGVDVGDELNKALLRRYRKQTRCGSKYKRAGVAECNGSVGLYQ